MNGWVSHTLCLSVILVSLLNSVLAWSSQDLHCGACRALVDELEWEISQVDPKKTIQMGSFRINPDGSQSVVEVPYARSEAHLTELLERVCEKMKEYGEKVDPATHRKSYVRVISHDGTKMDLSETKMDGDVTSRLKFASRPWTGGAAVSVAGAVSSRAQPWCLLSVTVAVAAPCDPPQC
ncbi:protein canopy homolog 2 isoform X3 [Chelonia mydas]|uniref:protein canopy homolog 2 isoform X3 n=1 Tax=Chelonia mydas TaxID=8469 RepID=UPI0018A20D26|nr:protein canopy homolog 2 isoform X3 [Chelonia mydas]